MTTPFSQSTYAVAQGTTFTTAFKFEQRDPTENDLKHPLYQGWVNTLTKAIWYLESFSSENGRVTALWRAVGPIVTSTVAPTTAEYQFPLGQSWVDTGADDYWVLVNVTGTTATWARLSAGTSGIDLLIPNSGTSPVVPDIDGQITLQGTGSITTVGGLNSLTPQLTGLTDNNVLVGAGSATITKVAPTATTGIPLVSQGAASDPSFSTAEVEGGGTGAVSLTDHGVLVGSGIAAVTATAVGATGTVLIGVTGADPAFSATPTVTSIGFGGSPLSSYIAYTSFVPGIAFGGGTTGITYAQQFGTYWKIGGVVFVIGSFTLSANGSSTGTATLTGLPITTKDDGATTASIILSFGNNITLGADFEHIYLLSVVNTTTMTFNEWGAGVGDAPLDNTDFASNSSAFFSGFYFADE